MGIISKKDKKKIKKMKNMIKKQKYTFSDGTKISTKIRGNPFKKKKIQLTIEVDKKIDDVDLGLTIQVKPYALMDSGFGYDPNSDEKFKIEAKATKKVSF